MERIVLGKRMLLVDDAAFMRMKLKQVLTELGHEVIGEGANGAEGVAQYAKLKPDAVTMDITMPEMDGIEALKQIRAMDPNAVVIMVSAMGQQGIVLDAVKAGAKDFIVKPFDPERVRKVMDSF
jgi:two-component system chemotaxis response regulator CheY